MYLSQGEGIHKPYNDILQPVLLVYYLYASKLFHTQPYLTLHLTSNCFSCDSVMQRNNAFASYCYHGTDVILYKVCVCVFASMLSITL